MKGILCQVSRREQHVPKDAELREGRKMGKARWALCTTVLDCSGSHSGQDRMMSRLCVAWYTVVELSLLVALKNHLDLKAL